MNAKVSKQAKERITAAIKQSPGNVKEGAFRVFDARECLREALKDAEGSTPSDRRTR